MKSHNMELPDSMCFLRWFPALDVGTSNKTVGEIRAMEQKQLKNENTNHSTNQSGVDRRRVVEKLVIQGLVREGAEVQLVEIQAAYTRGFAGVQLLGNLTEVCRSGKERARAALELLSINLAAQRLVLGFTPAGIRIDGAQMDLPMAIALAEANDGFKFQGRTFPGIAFAAELGLQGALRAVPGMVALALGAARQGCRHMAVAKDSLDDLRGIDLAPMEVHGFTDLKSVLAWLEGDASGVCVPDAESPEVFDPAAHAIPRFEDMDLTPEQAKVAMVVAAGRHNLLMRGTPGSGKTMFAQRLPGIMIPPEGQEKLRCLHLHNLAGNSLLGIRAGLVPFRSPHHSASMAAVLGNHASPGEISLAHAGILFLDELPEFRRDLLESLREPLESAEVHLARVKGHVIWPAGAVLVAASNNCPCGWTGSRVRRCRCATGQVVAYQGRMSGPLLDRIDIHLNMPERRRLASGADSATASGESDLVPKIMTTSSLREKVCKAAAFARERCVKLGIEPGTPNARLPDPLLKVALGWAACGGQAGVAGVAGDSVAARLEEVAKEDGRGFLADVCRSISSRGLVRALRVARTLADLDTVEVVGYEHFRQALLWQAEAAARERGDINSARPAERSIAWNR
jgi:magnesium chelatase family protein